MCYINKVLIINKVPKCFYQKVMGLFHLKILTLSLLLVVSRNCIAVDPHVGEIKPGFEASQVEWNSNDGQFLKSRNSTFALGFFATLDVKLFVLVITHLGSSKNVWTANRGRLISNSDKFVFDKNGDVHLTRGNSIAWFTNTTGEKVTAMELLDSGNLVLLGDNRKVLWQSFSHPTDTLLPGQEFFEGMQLKTRRNRYNVSLYLEIKSGNLVMYAGYDTPQVYWSLTDETRRTNNSVKGKVHSVLLVSNSWNFYDSNRNLVWQFIFSEISDPSAFWAAVLGPEGAISFYNFHKGKTVIAEATKIPQGFCSNPEPCDRYYVCYSQGWCDCPVLLKSRFNCKPETIPSCNRSFNANSSMEFLYVGEKLDYFAIEYVTPSIMNTSLNACKTACLNSCDCFVMFFDKSSAHCFMFDQIGSFRRSAQGSNGYVSYMKVLTNSGGGTTLSPAKKDGKMGRKHAIVVIVISISAVLLVVGILYAWFSYHCRKMRLIEFSQDTLDEDSFLDGLSGRPVRFTYNDLRQATHNFSMKIGHGGFGSVYLGVLPDGMRLAVKKLERIGQGKKEFRAEVSIIGSIHHIHLVRLKGFCAEGSHRLLVYEYMSKGSLDKWIFENNKDNMLDWKTRFNIALGTAKGLAYLHEECEAKIIHCDIKPENVLLDDNFSAKVSDFGLAKLTNRDESLVYTTMRGTRGYLAPEWITNCAISEKSDVYSYGMVLLEIISGRKNFDPSYSSEKTHFPSYAFRMLEEEKLKEIVDSELEIDEEDQRVVTAIKVALWCVQQEMHLRPPMTKVVQMLEGLCAVPVPPAAISHTALEPSLLKWNSEEASSSGMIDFCSDNAVSGVRLSGPT